MTPHSLLSIKESWGTATNTQANELLWNRTRDTHGGPGRNDPLDSHSEHQTVSSETTQHTLCTDL